MKKIIPLIVLLLPILATAQNSPQNTPKKINLAGIGGSGVSSGPGTGLTQLEKTKIDSAINAKASRDSTKLALDELRVEVDSKKDFNPDEEAFTAADKTNIQNALNRPVYNPAQVRLKADLIPSSDITGTVPIDSVGGLNVNNDSLKAAINTKANRDSTKTVLDEIKLMMDGKKNFDPDEVPFTAAEQSNIQNALSRPVYNQAAVRLKADAVPSTDITGTIPLDSTFVGNAVNKDFYITALKWLGSGWKAISFTSNVHQAGSGQDIPDSSVRFQFVPLSHDTVIRSIGFGQFLKGVFTATGNNKLGLYKVNTTYDTIHLVASTANNPNLFANNKGMVYEPLTAPYEAKAGAYFVGLLYCRSSATTVPQWYSATVDSDHPTALDFAADVRWSMHLNSRSDLPSFVKFSSLSTNADRPLFILKY